MKKFNVGRWRRAALAGVAVAVWFALWGQFGSPASTDGTFGEAVATFGQAAPQAGGPAPGAGGASPKPNAAPPVPEKPPAPAPMSKRVVEYHIGAALDPKTRTLHGSQTVTWRNPGKQKVQELYFHLYPNAFESDKTTFNRESGGKLRNDKRTENSYGSMTIAKIETTEGMDLTHRIAYEQPDDGNASDRTLMKLRLPQAVAPGATVTLKMAFEVSLPEVFARMGYKDDFYMIGQWFPKLAVYEPAGTRGRTAEGWNAHQYHGNSEYYADFGIYNVKIQVPSDYVVAATGFPPKPAVADKKNGTKTYHFYADDVHDFAWAASPNFVYAEEPYSAPNVPGVKIKLYLDPAHLELKDRYFYAAKKSLEHFSAWYGPYPYSTLSIVVPPPGAGGAGGMEYPTLITAWAADATDAGYELERVVVHEIGHQYWYGMVASNEFEEAWLDEGFTSYAEDKLMEAEYGVTPSTTLEASYMTNPASLTRFAWNFDSHDHYADNVYIRGKLVLLAMEKEIGEAKMKRVLRAYFDRWKFKHPSTGDFQRTVEDVTKTSWAPFFDQFVYGDQMVDYAVERIEKLPPPASGQFAYRVTVSGRAGLDGPVYVRFLYEDGQSIKQEWKGDEASAVFTLPPHTAKLRHVVVDPDGQVVLEHKRINNFMKTDVDEKTETRWTMGVAKLLEALLGTVAW
ncbi:MAG TPA: M1 family metallopeptidase [Paenibacillus sp.]|nr:M1 family metallopeptidase [Paenibacillus sp.]